MLASFGTGIGETLRLPLNGRIVTDKYGRCLWEAVSFQACSLAACWVVVSAHFKESTLPTVGATAQERERLFHSGTRARFHSV
jgi:hypothetical protein